MNNREDIMSKMFVYTMIAIMLVAFATVEQVVAEASFEVQAIATIADGNVSGISPTRLWARSGRRCMLG
jgi:hypothetical protein